MVDYQELLECYIEAAIEENDAKCKNLEAEFIRKYGNDTLSLFKREKLPSIPAPHSRVDRRMSSVQRYYENKKAHKALSLQSYDMNQMWSEYNNLLNCYATAQTISQLQRCDTLAQDFTQRYGGLTSLATINLNDEEKRAVSQAIDQIEREAIQFRTQYYRSKPQVQRDLQQAVAQAEANLNNIDAEFDDVRQFLGLKTLASSNLSLQTVDYE